jgi:hypothetical protein
MRVHHAPMKSPGTMNCTPSIARQRVDKFQPMDRIRDDADETMAWQSAVKVK